MVEEALAINDVVDGVVEVPQANTTPERAVGELADNLLDPLRTDVTVAGSAGGGRDTDKDLRVAILFAAAKDGFPLAVVEGVQGVAGQKALGVTARVVVELDEESVKVGLRDHLLHLEEERVDRAFRGSGDEQAGVELTEALDHGNVRVVVLTG